MNPLKSVHERKILEREALTLRPAFLIIPSRCSFKLSLLSASVPSRLFTSAVFSIYIPYFLIHATLFTGDKVTFVTICFYLVVQQTFQ